jgi:hypothetical protein
VSPASTANALIIFSFSSLLNAIVCIPLLKYTSTSKSG